ncbi:MAG: STAS domain-containing protein [Gammaproteobacteria bacterium]|nr:STAS domain-containing protein [Gammaproteobacteria bacterium]
MSDKATFTLPEQLDIAQVESVKDRMDKTLEKEVSKIEVKAEKVERMDSAGMQLLLSFRATIIESDREMILLKPSEGLLAVAELLGTSELLELG